MDISFYFFFSLLSEVHGEELEKKQVIEMSKDWDQVMNLAN